MARPAQRAVVVRLLADGAGRGGGHPPAACATVEPHSLAALRPCPALGRMAAGAVERRGLDLAAGGARAIGVLAARSGGGGPAARRTPARILEPAPLARVRPGTPLDRDATRPVEP